MKKKCYRCKTVRDIKDFYRSKDRKDGVQASCKKCSSLIGKGFYKKHKDRKSSYYKNQREIFPEKYVDYNKKRKIQRREKKIFVINKYGGKCSCCGEKEIIFLSVDHKDNDGAIHRKSIGGSSYIYDWIIRNNFPSSIQVLCHNCNQGKYINGGICPHKKK